MGEITSVSTFFMFLCIFYQSFQLRNIWAHRVKSSTRDLKYLESSDIDPWDNNVIVDSPLNFKSCKQVGKDKNTHSEQNTSLSCIYSQEYVHTKNGPDGLIGAVEITETFRDAAGFQTDEEKYSLQARHIQQ